MPVIHRSLRATCRPSTSAVVRNREHDQSPIKPCRSLRWQATARRGALLLRDSTRQAFTAQGSLWPEGLGNTRPSVRTPLRIYPNLFQPGHLLSLPGACRRLEVDDDERLIGSRCSKHRVSLSLTKTVAFAMWENQLAQLTAPKHGAPCRAASRGASRKNPTFDRTRGAFHLRDLILLDPGRQPSRRRSSPCRSGHADTFVTSDGRQP